MNYVVFQFYVSVMFPFYVFFVFSVLFLIKFGLCLVFLCFCYVCYVGLSSVVFSSIFSFCVAIIFLFNMYCVKF